MINKESETWKSIEAFTAERIALLKDKLTERMTPEETELTRIEIKVWRRILRLPAEQQPLQAETFGIHD